MDNPTPCSHRLQVLSVCHGIKVRAHEGLGGGREEKEWEFDSIKTHSVDVWNSQNNGRHTHKEKKRGVIISALERMN